MSIIEPYTVPPLRAASPGFRSRLSRQTGQQLAVLDQGTELRTAAIAAAAEVQQSKVDAVARTGGYAMQQAALLAQMQQQLALAAPAASGDLDMIKTMTLIGIGQVVADTTRVVNGR